MKKFTLLMVAGLFALAGSVQAQKKVAITANDITVANGETTDLVISMNYPTTESVAGYNFSLYLPEGITFGRASLSASVTIPTKETDVYPVITYMEYDEEQDAEVEKTAAPKSLLKISEKNDGGILFIWIDDTYGQTPLAKTEGMILKMNVKATADVVGVGTIKGVGFTSTSSVSLDLGNLDDYTFAVNGDSQGINDIQAADATAPAYNLQGVRVNNNAKGVIIREGKKMIVK